METCGKKWGKNLIGDKDAVGQEQYHIIHELILWSYAGLFIHSQPYCEEDLRRQKDCCSQINIPHFEPLSYLDSKEVNRSVLYYEGI